MRLLVIGRTEATSLGDMLVEQLYFRTVKGENVFKDGGTLYQFHEDDSTALNTGGDVSKCKTVGGACTGITLIIR